MWYQLTSYINFLFRSTNHHGVHSPFVFNLVTNCFYDKNKYADYQMLKNIRSKLNNDDQIIKIMDFGEGSRVFSSPKRKVSDIAKYAGITPKRQKLLYRLVRYLKSENILELGTSIGLATSAMSLANPDATIYTVEGCQNTAEIAQRLFKKHALNNINLNRSVFNDFIEKISTLSESTTKQRFDLIYIDGNHNKEDTIHYFNSLINHIHDHSVIILDDIHWSRSMTNAWKKIIQHPRVIISINTFYWGLLFFKPAFKQANIKNHKQHFCIRL